MFSLIPDPCTFTLNIKEWCCSSLVLSLVQSSQNSYVIISSTTRLRDWVWIITYCSFSLELQASTILCTNLHFLNSCWQKRGKIMTTLDLPQIRRYATMKTKGSHLLKHSDLTWLMRMHSLAYSSSVFDTLPVGEGGRARIKAVHISTWMWRKLFHMYLKYISCRQI